MTYKLVSIDFRVTYVPTGISNLIDQLFQLISFFNIFVRKINLRIENVGFKRVTTILEGTLENYG